MPETTVLITGAGTVTCQSVLKGLRTQDEIEVRIVTVDMNTDVAGRYLADAFHEVPAAGDEDFIPRLRQICGEEEVDLLVPIVDYEFNKLARNKPDFEYSGTEVVISSPETIDISNDKWKTYKFFREQGIPTPATFLPESLPSDPTYPLFIKPRVMGRASIDSYQIDTPEELSFYLQKLDNPIVQEAVEGEEFTIDVLCDREGEAINAVPRQRVETKAGVSYKGRTVGDSNLIEQGARVAEALDIVGPCNVQCFRNGDGLSFFEVNPRYSGTLALSIAAGFNSPLDLVRVMRGDEVSSGLGDFRSDTFMMRYWQEVFVHEDSSSKGYFSLKA